MTKNTEFLFEKMKCDCQKYLIENIYNLKNETGDIAEYLEKMQPLVENYGEAARNALDGMREKKKIWTNALKLILNYSALIYE